MVQIILPKFIGDKKVITHTIDLARLKSHIKQSTDFQEQCQRKEPGIIQIVPQQYLAYQDHLKSLSKLALHDSDNNQVLDRIHGTITQHSK